MGDVILALATQGSDYIMASEIESNRSLVRGRKSMFVFLVAHNSSDNPSLPPQ